MATVILNNKTQETKRVSYVCKNEDGSLYFCNRNFTPAGSQFKSNWEGILTVADEGVNGHFPVTLLGDWTVATQGKGKKSSGKVGKKAPKLSPLATALLVLLGNSREAAVKVAADLGLNKDEAAKAAKKAEAALEAAVKAQDAVEKATAKLRDAQAAYNKAGAKYDELVYNAINNASEAALTKAIAKASAAKASGKTADGKGKTADGKGKK